MGERNTGGYDTGIAPGTYALVQANEKEADESNQEKRRGHPHLFYFIFVLFCFVCF